jgi:hypothetical protein
MMTEWDERELGGLFERAAPGMRPEMRGRALEAMAAARPARARWRRGLLAAAVGAAMVAAGAGLLPFGSKDGRGAWARAAQMASQADSLHVVGTIRMDGNDYEFEKWVSADGFRRYEVRSDDEFIYVNLQDEERETGFYLTGEGGFGYVKANAPGVGGPAPASRSDALTDLLQLVPFMKGCRDLRFTARAQAAADGRSVEMVGGSGTFENELHHRGYGTFYRGTPLRFRAEVDCETGLLTSLQCWRGTGAAWHQEPDMPLRWLPGAGILSTIWKGSGDDWELIYATEVVEWNVPVPESAREFAWPEGTRVRYQRWLEPRGAQELAIAEVSEGEVILHSLDVNERGDIFVTISRPGRGAVGPPWCTEVGYPDFEAVDDWGYVYRQSGHYRGGMCGFDREYEVTDLGRALSDGEAPLPTGESAPRAQTLTITIWPYSNEWHTGESVTFEGVPLPEPQSGIDLYKETVEYIEY